MEDLGRRLPLPGRRGVRRPGAGRRRGHRGPARGPALRGRPRAHVAPVPVRPGGAVRLHRQNSRAGLYAREVGERILRRVRLRRPRVGHGAAPRGGAHPRAGRARAHQRQRGLLHEPARQGEPLSLQRADGHRRAGSRWFADSWTSRLLVPRRMPSEPGGRSRWPSRRVAFAGRLDLQLRHRLFRRSADTSDCRRRWHAGGAVRLRGGRHEPVGGVREQGGRVDRVRVDPVLVLPQLAGDAAGPRVAGARRPRQRPRLRRPRADGRRAAGAPGRSGPAGDWPQRQAVADEPPYFHVHVARADAREGRARGQGPFRLRLRG
mmetsp:Transcript_60184/g.183822  ORF Transcript_60184/g.183822 Transcript_60184/m.183822 type:complete len:320 (-) Transcript_60184:523-1482(-)